MPFALRNALLLASCTIALPAIAQEDQQKTTVLQTITVTAQRRVQAAKDVPVSLQVFSQEDIDKRIVKRLEDAFAATPNASLTSQRGGNDASSLSIRGVTTMAFGADPSIGVYVDDVYVGNDNGFNVRVGGLEQIEILRGPQGTLYGRNAVGGAVNIRTLSPVIGVNSGSIETGIGTDGLFFGVANGNVALGENAAANMSFYGDRSDGWVKNAQGGPDQMNLDNYGGRGKLLLKPADDWAIEFSGDYGRDKGRRSGYGLFDTVWENGVNQAIPNLDETENYGGSIKSTWSLDAGELTSVTAWRGASAAGGGGNFTPVALQGGSYERDYDQYTQEVRLNGESDSFDWTVGAFLLWSKEKRFEAANFFPALPANMLFTGQPALPANYVEGTHSDVSALTASVFGDMAWHATDRLDVIAGTRLSYDRKSIDYDHGSVLGNVALLAPALETSQSVHGLDISPRIGLTYALSDDVKAYGTISRGYKPKGFNISFAPDNKIAYDAESAINYEVGLKGETLDSRISYSLSAFYFDWKDQQIYAFENNRLFIDNAPKSRSYGAEAQIDAEVVDGLRAHAGAGLLNATFVNYPNALSGTDESGNRQPLASKFSASLGLQYTHMLTDGHNLVARADYDWKSSFFWDTANRIREPGYGVVNLRIGLEKDRWSLTAFARNVFDQEYRIRAATYSGQSMAIPGTPRTIGLMAKVGF